MFRCQRRGALCCSRQKSCRCHIDFAVLLIATFAHEHTGGDSKEPVPCRVGRLTRARKNAAFCVFVLRFNTKSYALRGRHKGVGVSLDTWKMMLDFSKNTAPDLSDMADFYPPFIDEFVEYVRVGVACCLLCLLF
jgi:hypothetical protein